MDGAQLRRGVHPQLVGQPDAELLVAVECLSRSSASVQGDQQSLPQGLAHRMPFCQPMQLDDACSMLTGVHVEIDATFQGHQLALDPGRCLVALEALGGVVTEQRLAPRRQGLRQDASFPLYVVCRLGGVDQIRECEQVDRAAIDAQRVATRISRHDLVADHSTQPGYVGLQASPHPFGRVLTPDPGRKGLGRDRTTRRKGKQGQERADPPTG